MEKPDEAGPTSEGRGRMEGVPGQEPQPLTCSVHEFAAMVGISRDHAYEMVHSVFPPPGFRVGKAYRIIRSRVPEYLDQLAERDLSMRNCQG